MPAQNLNRSRMLHLPRRFRTRLVEIDAMQFHGSSNSGKDIVNWVFLSGGVASWTEATPAFESDDGLQGCPAEPSRLTVCCVEVAPGSWVLRDEDSDDDQWNVMDDAQFYERYQSWP
jgi:hypothetical protein